MERTRTRHSAAGGSDGCARVALLVMAAWLGACDGTRAEVLTLRPDATVSDLPGDDVQAHDAPAARATDGRADAMDAADAPTGCRVDGDCAGDPRVPVCEPASGRCVVCRPELDGCPADRHCDPLQRLCVQGCRIDEGCVGSVADGGGVAARVCDTAVHECVQCRDDGHCPAGLLCAGQRCVPGCSATQACPGGAACCEGACVDRETDPSNCGACGVRCAVDHGAPGCAAGRCTVAACAAGFGDCDGAPANGCETDFTITLAHCGACGTRCPTLANGTSTCMSGACDVVCRDGFVLLAGACVAVPPPRPAAPLSTATVTSRRPTLRWALGGGTDGARVEVCRDRACGTVVATFDAVGASGAPAADLPPGVLFWRTRGRAGASTGTAVGATWQFTVGARSAPVDTSWGTTLDVNGDGYADLVVGAWGSGDTGRAYVFLGGPGGLSTTPATTLTGPDLTLPVGVDASFGWSVASAGDVNGDGYADLVVGTRDVGRAFLYLGGAGGLSPIPATSLTGPGGGGFGQSVAGAGDVNGDGYADVVVGAQNTDIPGASGQAYVYLGGAGGLSATPATTLTERPEPGGSGGFGWSVASAGDVNGDGYADLVVGDSSNTVFRGRAYVYLGGTGGISSTPITTLTQIDETEAFFGWSVSSAGDVNGDGYADVVVGAAGVHYAARANVYLGGAGGLSATPNTTLAGTAGLEDSPFSPFALSVANAGDLNGDGYVDLVMGARTVMNEHGRVYVYFGGAAGLFSTPLALPGPAGALVGFGQSVAGAGDVDGDGYADLVVGAPYAVVMPPPSSGLVYVYRGRPGVLSTTPSTILHPLGADRFGWSVASTRYIRDDRDLASFLGTASMPFDRHPCRSDGIHALHFSLPAATYTTAAARFFPGPRGIADSVSCSARQTAPGA